MAYSNNQRFAYSAAILIGLLLSSCCQQPEKPPKKRDAAMVKLFRQDNPCPATGKTKGACPGYVVDHIVPLKRGGGDHPYNMQWQTAEEGKLKDRWE